VPSSTSQGGISALSTGSPLTAGAIMAVFALGTAPGLLALGGLPAVLPARWQPTLLRAIGVVLLGFALLNAVAGFRLAGFTPSVVGGGEAAAAAPQVTVADGVQTLRTFQVAAGYLPADTAIYAGMPTRWIVESLDQQSWGGRFRRNGVAISRETGWPKPVKSAQISLFTRSSRRPARWRGRRSW